MPASSTSTLSLAGRLRDLGDDDLIALLTAREVRDVRVRDFFDLADALLESTSIQRALAGLDRMTLAALASVPVSGATTETIAARVAPLLSTTVAVAAALNHTRALALLDRDSADWLGYAPVLEQFALWKVLGLPDADALIAEQAPAFLVPVGTTDARFTDHAASEHAFNATNAVAALLAELQREPARELARGGIALPETKRLATAMSVELDDVPAIVAIAARAQLASLESGSWMVTEFAGDWLLKSNGERWARLATAWFARLPDDIRDLLASRARGIWGDRLADYIRWFYPAGGDWMRDRVLAYSREAELLGITANSTPSTAGSQLLAGGETDAANTMASLFPPEIDNVYLQHDLTIVAPGPLLPTLDARLRSIANVETRALATTYRVSESTINRALTVGETADSIREFLDGISLTGIPQPLEYLIVGAAARFGSLRVGAITDPGPADQQGAQSYVRADDTSVLSAILVDHGLIPLGLTRGGPYRATSRFDFEVVFWSLTEARYPVVAEDANGTILQLDRIRPPRASAAESESPAETIVHRLRLVAEPTSEDNDKAWLERQLDTAIKAKMGLTVTVAMPDGSSVELQLEPASVAGGRLRARDRRSDLERTLPLSSITAVGPAEL
ncbi:MAG TPA: helicase-associated domain-containing protein [Galbitalea sp.]|nr:helicase-associated domain-containing protein [Galbitalea sp.]